MNTLNKLRQRRRGQKGFTLIELLVVIAIIGVLATLILIGLNAARARARDARSESNLNQAFTICVLRNDSKGDFSGCTVSDQSETEEPGAIARLDTDTKRIDGVPGATSGGLIISLDAAPASSTRACVLSTMNAKAGGTNKKFCRDTAGNVSPTSGATGAACNAGTCIPGTP